MCMCAHYAMKVMFFAACGHTLHADLGYKLQNNIILLLRVLVFACQVVLHIQFNLLGVSF